MQKYVIALYIRLSIEDYKYDSLSIENQSLVLHEYAASMPETMNAEITEFIDNGYSGTNFERPQVQRLIELVRANQIDCIIVKDFSRFGRNSIETGYFIERVFPLFHTRFISISDDFDSSKFKGDTGGIGIFRFQKQLVTRGLFRLVGVQVNLTHEIAFIQGALTVLQRLDLLLIFGAFRYGGIHPERTVRGKRCGGFHLLFQRQEYRLFQLCGVQTHLVAAAFYVRLGMAAVII